MKNILPAALMVVGIALLLSCFTKEELDGATN